MLWLAGWVGGQQGQAMASKLQQFAARGKPGAANVSKGKQLQAIASKSKQWQAMPSNGKQGAS
jgi:hypothetical protein